MKKREWYLSPWFICLLFAGWPFIFPVVAGVVCLCKYYQFEKAQSKDYSAINDARDFVTAAETAQKNILQKVSETEQGLKASQEASKLAVDKLKAEISALKIELEFYQTEAVVASSAIVVDENISSEEYKNELSMLKLKQSELIKSDNAINVSEVGNKKTLNNNIKQLLRCFNAECEIIISNASIKNIDLSRSRLSKAYEALNKIFATDFITLNPALLSMKLDELNLIYSFKLRQEQERDEQRAIREQMLEEDKVRREIEAEKTKLEKEESQFKNEVTKLMAYMAKTSNDLEKQLYIDKIKDLEEKLRLLAIDKENVLQREQNTRAGFVYIISNIGSFGENVFKIGMTRRLEPMDRVKELGDASVPFEFDVHAMIFAEDAPLLETMLHDTFRENQINKINTRKEFFKIDLAKIEKVVKENHNATVTFTQVAKAEQYRASLALEKA